MEPLPQPTGHLRTFPFEEQIDKIILKYQTNKRKKSKPKIKKDKVMTFIQKLVLFTKTEEDTYIQEYLQILEDKVTSTQGGHWIPLCWAYSEILHHRDLPRDQGCRKFKEFFQFCVHHRANSLSNLYQIMVMIDHAGRLGPLNRETVIQPARIGHSQLGTCTMEEIILHRVRSLSLSQKEPLPEIKSLNDIGQAVFGSNPVKMTISDFYPTTLETIKRVKNPHTFHRLQASFRKKVQSGMILTDVPKLIREMVDVCRCSTKNADGAIYHLLDNISRPEPLGVIEALTFLWVYVGVLDKRKIETGEIQRTKPKLDVLVSRLFKAAVQKDKEKNLEHLANLWNAVWYLHFPTPIRGRAYFPITEAVLNEAYPDDNLLLDQSGVSYEPDKFYEAMSMNRSLRPEEISQCEPKRDGDPEEIKIVQDGAKKLKLNKHEHKSRTAQCLNEDNLVTNQEDQGQQETWEATDLIPPPELANHSTPTTNASPSPPRKNKEKRDKDKNSGVNSDQVVTSVASTHLDAPVFITDPNVHIRMNPNLLPSDDSLDWSARCLLPPKKMKMSKNTEDSRLTPDNLTEIPRIPSDCTETLLRVNFTSSEYIDATLADNYYAQGIKVVNGIRRVVFYHRENTDI